MLNEELIQLALNSGATKATVIRTQDIVMSASFRDICKSNGCGLYGKCWMCPPDVGPIEELMARIRKYPAISYLVISIFPLIPGAGVYYTMNHAVQGNMESFASQGGHTAAIAGVIAVGVLLISTAFRMFSIWKQSKKKKS